MSTEPHSSNVPMTAQLVMPWFMGAALIPKFDGDKSKFKEWSAQVEVMLRAQGLNEQQQADFVLGALEGEAKRELQLADPRDKRTGQKVLETLKKLFDEPQKRAELRATFFKCKQRPDENVNAFVLRLREVISKWQEQDENVSTERDDLLLDQLIAGLQPGPIKLELTRQMRRKEGMTFTEICKEVRDLEREQHRGEYDTLSQRVATSHRQSTTGLDLDQLRSELKDGLIGELKKEMMDQMRVLSEELMKEVRAQWSTREGSQTFRIPVDHSRTPARGPRAQLRPAGPAYQYDPQGRPICRRCGVAGHIQRRCPQGRAEPQDF